MNKSLAKIAKDPRVFTISDETNGVNNDGYWILLKDGYYCKFSESHAVHEWSITKLLQSFKTVIPCKCKDCARF